MSIINKIFQQIIPIDDIKNSFEQPSCFLSISMDIKFSEDKKKIFSLYVDLSFNCKY